MVSTGGGITALKSEGASAHFSVFDRQKKAGACTARTRFGYAMRLGLRFYWSWRVSTICNGSATITGAGLGLRPSGWPEGLSTVAAGLLAVV